MGKKSVTWALVVAHIAEMSRRKGHLERGYKNLFDYCTRRLNLSEGSVYLRIQVAKVSRRFPQILVALAAPPPETRPVPRISPSILEPAQPEVFNFRFAANREFKEKFERLAEVLGVENPLQHMAEIMEQAMDIALDKKDMKRKLTRRRAKKMAKSPRPDEVPPKSRYIPTQKRERVHEKAGYRCQYRYPGEDRCRSAGAWVVRYP